MNEHAQSDYLQELKNTKINMVTLCSQNVSTSAYLFKSSPKKCQFFRPERNSEKNLSGVVVFNRRSQKNKDERRIEISGPIVVLLIVRRVGTLIMKLNSKSRMMRLVTESGQNTALTKQMLELRIKHTVITVKVERLGKL